MHEGLTDAEARKRLLEIGTNELEQRKSTSLLRLFWHQLASPMVLLLAAAGILSVVLGETLDAIVIGAIVALNAAVGVIQEGRAERAIEALRAITAPHAHVVREGLTKRILSAEIVPGDVLRIEAGDVVAADAEILQSVELELDEASLTGESHPVRKSVEEPKIFMGTHAVSGTAHAQVSATGMRTEMGKIADFLNHPTNRRTPLQERLDRVGRMLVLICLGIVAVVAAGGLARGLPLSEVAMSALSLAVASIPEGLPVVVTVALALGVQRMAKQHVLVRRLAAVEALGSVTVICTDKTGTLTTGVMSVREIVGDEALVLQTVLGCVNATISGDDVLGSPTEVALVRAARERGLDLSALTEERIEEQPFSSATKWMWVRHEGGVVAKGAPDVLFTLCQGDIASLTDATDEMASRGLRTLAVARGPDPSQLTLIGLVGIADPPRESAKTALAAAHRAGITTVMITGDHALTALAIANELGLVEPGADPADRVHARATPADKVRIVESWRERGAIVAMTGDGVNDAPALERAHVGIAMGRTGTEVTREAADIILTDDDYAHIIEGVREGRGIDANIRKTLVYLLGGNAGEIGLVLAAVVLGLPTPLLPLHLLWINVVTDGLPALALSTDPAPIDALDHPPRPQDTPVLGRPEWSQIAKVAALDAGATLAVFVYALSAFDLPTARTLAFMTLVVAEVSRAISARHMDLPIWKHGLPVNRWLLAVVVGTFFLQLGLLSTPFTRQFLHLTPLSPTQGLLVMGAGLIPLVVMELSKAFKTR